MKKQLLTAAILLAAYFSAGAQEQILTSFEATETAGYTAGDDIGTYTDYWSTYSTLNTGDVDSGIITITDEWASEGSQSLKLAAVTTQNDDENYAFGPLLDYTSLLSSAFSLKADVRTNLVSDVSSNLWIGIINYDSDAQTQTPVARVMFDYSGDLYVWDSSIDQTAANNYGYVSAAGYAANTNYTVSFRFNADGSITYLLGEDEIYTFTPADSAVLNGYYYPAISTDDYNSDWYVDNLVVDVPTAGTKTVTSATLSVYPNPATDVVNVANAGLINSIKVTDLNGRTVKSAAFDGVDAAQVNIADLAAGVYMMGVASDKGTSTTKIVKN